MALMALLTPVVSIALFVMLWRAGALDDRDNPYRRGRRW